MIRARAAAASLALLFSTSSLSPAWAQTALGSKGQGQVPTRTIGQAPASQVPTTPPGKASASGAPAQQAPAQQQPSQQPAQQAQQAASKIPMSGDSYTQALYQSEGVFPEMQRQGSGGQIQEAWNLLGEARQGVYVTRLCEDCVYKVRAREFMITTLVLPEDAVIATADLGDRVGFKVQVKAANMIAVRPTGYGFDTNLNVYSRSGAVYPFYIRSESFNSKFVPDVMVKILGREKPEVIEGFAGDAGTAGRQEKGTLAKPGDKTAAAIRDLTSPAPPAGDFVRKVPFDPAKLHGWKDYKLSGDSELKPEVVYRDDFFTYIRYGEKWDGMELSTAYVTIDGIDELVNSRVQGSTFIVESVSPLITLKNGKKYLCIRYTGEKP
jgi:ComB9 competence protein